MNRPISLGAESMLGVVHKVLDHGEPGDFGMSAGEVAEFAAKLARLSNARV